jgi:hypothetical protein
MWQTQSHLATFPVAGRQPGPQDKLTNNEFHAVRSSPLPNRDFPA